MKVSSIASVLAAGALAFAIGCSKDDKKKNEEKPAAKAPAKTKAEPVKKTAVATPSKETAQKATLLALKFHHDD